MDRLRYADMVDASSAAVTPHSVRLTRIPVKFGDAMTAFKTWPRTLMNKTNASARNSRPIGRIWIDVLELWLFSLRPQGRKREDQKNKQEEALSHPIMAQSITLFGFIFVIFILPMAERN